jgi:hypothetical protein
MTRTSPPAHARTGGAIIYLISLDHSDTLNSIAQRKALKLK